MFANPGLHKHVKDHFVTSLVESKLFYCCQCWSADPAPVMEILDGTRLKSWRSVRNWHNYQREGDHIPDSSVWFDSKCLPAKEYARVARLRYLPRLCKVSPVELFAMLQASIESDRSWQRLVYDDFSLMQQLADHADPVKLVPHPAENPHAAFAYFAGAAIGWNQAVKRFAANLRRRHVQTLLDVQSVPEQAHAGAKQHVCALCPSGAVK